VSVTLCPNCELVMEFACQNNETTGIVENWLDPNDERVIDPWHDIIAVLNFSDGGGKNFPENFLFFQNISRNFW